MLHAKFQDHRTFGSGDSNIFKGFYHISAWRPSWLRDLDNLFKLSFPVKNEGST